MKRLDVMRGTGIKDTRLAGIEKQLPGTASQRITGEVSRCWISSLNAILIVNKIKFGEDL